MVNIYKARLLLFIFLHLHAQVKSSSSSNSQTEKDVLKKVTKRGAGNVVARWCYQNPKCRQGALGSGWEEGECKSGIYRSPHNLDPRINWEPRPFFTLFKEFQPSWNLTLTNFTLANEGGKLVLTPRADWKEHGIRFEWEKRYYHYIFDHLEFHWGPYDDVGSEHSIGDVSASMEMQIVYWYSKWANNYTHALKSVEMGALGIIGILLVADPNIKGESHLEPIVSNLAKLGNGGGGGEQKVDVEDKTFVLRNFLPSGTTVYAYNGSMTSPPCKPIVQWFILRNPAFIKPSDVEAFRNSIKDEGGNYVKMNYRKMQYRVRGHALPGTVR